MIAKGIISLPGPVGNKARLREDVEGASNEGLAECLVLICAGVFVGYRFGVGRRDFCLESTSPPPWLLRTRAIEPSTAQAHTAIHRGGHHDFGLFARFVVSGRDGEIRGKVQPREACGIVISYRVHTIFRGCCIEVEEVQPAWRGQAGRTRLDAGHRMLLYSWRPARF